MKQLNLCYFDNNFGEYDEFNPRYVFNTGNTLKIVSLLSENIPFYYTIDTLSSKLGVDQIELLKDIKLLENVSAITLEEEKLKLNFPFFNNADISQIINIINTQLNNIYPKFEAKILNLQEFAKKLYPNIDAKTTLYHLLCGKLFDGMFFDYLEDKKLLKMSYPKKDNRDYVIIGYEDSEFCNNFNDGLLCSFNNARYNNCSLSSFGNPNNYRYDYFRFFRFRQMNKLPEKYKYVAKEFGNINDQEILKNTFNAINSLGDDKYSNILREFGYANKNEIIVPIFNNCDINIKKLYNYVVDTVGNDIVESLNFIKKEIVKSNISSILHQVDIDEIFNEIWHMYFGLLNNFLVEKNLVATPKEIDGEGRYLKCIYLN